MPFIILDRDGVINYDSEFYIKNPDEWIAIPGSLEAIAQLNRLGYRVLVATNQSGVARGFYDLAMLDQIHEKFQRELAAVGGIVEEIFYCPHHPEEKCICRKPQPGMFQQIQKKYPINLAETYFVGDNLSDVQVAKLVGCKPLFVLSGKNKNVLVENPELTKIPYFADLAAAVSHILQEEKAP